MKTKKSKTRQPKNDEGEDHEALVMHHSEADIHLGKKAKTKARGSEYNRHREGTIQKAGNLVEGEGLDFADILNELEFKTNDQPSGDQVNTTKLKKQLKNLKRDGSKVLSAPLSGYKKVKIMREQAQEVNSKLVSKYQPQVKANREAD